jgi:hypothetical protein
VRRAVPTILAAALLCGCPVEEPPPVELPGCPAGEHRERDACVLDVCGDGDWGDIDRSGAVVHVAKWGNPEGDGSEDAPVDTIALGMELAAGGLVDLVAIDLGTYAESLAFSRAIDVPHIEGRCAQGVILDGGEPVLPTISVLGGTVQVRGMTITGGGPGVFAGRTDGGLPTDLLLADVLFEDSVGHALVASGQDVVVGLEYVTVASALPFADGNDGNGISAQGTARISTVGLEIEDVPGVAVHASDDDTEVHMLASWIRGGQAGGVLVEAGARLTSDRLVVETARRIAVQVTGPGSGADLLDSEIRQTLRDEAGSAGTGVGLQVDGQAGVQATRLVIADSEGPGAIAALGGTLACEQCTLMGNAVAGAAAIDGGVLRLDGGRVLTSVATDEQPGSGVGVYGWAAAGEPTIDLTELELANHDGPAVYLRGQGRYQLAGVSLDASGQGEGVQALLVALDGVDRWEGGAGLRVADSTLTHVALDGMLLHASSATLEGVAFEQGAGFDLYLQQCDGVDTPDVSGGEAIDNGCAGEPRVVEPRIEVLLP